LQQLEAAELMLKVFQGKEVKWYITKIELTLNSWSENKLQIFVSGCFFFSSNILSFYEDKP
jgi:hypothetical protein